MNSKDYGNIVKEARLKKGLSQTQLAENCHLGLRTVQRIESGQVTPRISTVKLINEFLDITISDYTGFKTENIDYKTLFYLGVSVFGLGIVFGAAINNILGLSFIIIGLINIFIGLDNKNKWSTKTTQNYLKTSAPKTENVIKDTLIKVHAHISKNLKTISLIVGVLMFSIAVFKIIYENSNQWLGVVCGAYLIWLFFNLDKHEK
jgi:transcriptional regulator with XRE-family HTH domain